ncbi:hypothetical protein H696_00785 [Fonticula alba]|uniref:Uncharacterized protein n=1 Tax=Fonticula alba TaxID=691883 RepID=A0A058ZFV9_FONAL|nr:hypothetical protein H696_00785 [Fonticula alba]KCV73244.1 hypothetical protein H696_00785 [Fonticula alba]|eukprot:XP_009492945.1 hypothetical protein H696_00785 [Fonticula alba]
MASRLPLICGSHLASSVLKPLLAGPRRLGCGSSVFPPSAKVGGPKAQVEHLAWFWQRVIENEKKSELDTSIEQWVPASRITEADETNDTTSVNRSLDKCLYFVVKNRKTGVWTFPAFKYNPDTDTTYDLKGQVSRFMTRSFAGSEASRFWVTSDWPAGTFIHPAQNMKQTLVGA